jgi:hypothetical protein
MTQLWARANTCIAGVFPVRVSLFKSSFRGGNAISDFSDFSTRKRRAIGFR